MVRNLVDREVGTLVLAAWKAAFRHRATSMEDTRESARSLPEAASHKWLLTQKYS